MAALTVENRRTLTLIATILGSSLDYLVTLRAVAQAAVPKVADWCTVHVLERGELRQLAIAHVDEQKVVFAEELQERYPLAASPFAYVAESGRAQLVSDVSEEMLAQAAVDELHLDILRELGLLSYMCVPLLAHDRILGVITFVTAESERRYDESDLGFAEELGRRAGTTIENARLYAEAEEQARAARVLATVGDGVCLVDREGIVRLWNPAAQAILGRTFRVTQHRGEFVDSPLAPLVTATVHPSSILRSRTDEERRSAFDAFVEDLRRVARAAHVSP